jgi:endoglucanase
MTLFSPSNRRNVLFAGVSAAAAATLGSARAQTTNAQTSGGQTPSAQTQGAQTAAMPALPPGTVIKDKRPIVYPDGSIFGVYDPHGDFSGQRNVGTEHLFLPWEGVDLTTLRQADAYAMARGRNILITIEPWSWAKDSNVTPAQLRHEIFTGQHDGSMAAILREAAKFRSKVAIRWAQEMEHKVNRFIWQNWNPDDYIKAFRRMTDITRRILPQATNLWSPKGELNLKDYYPGDKYVDVVGLSVFGLEAYDKIAYGQPRNFEESVKQGYELSVGFNKPIWVAELGYEGSPEYLMAWMQGSAKKYAQYAELKEVIYFNDREVWEWPYNLGLPPWRVVRDAPTYPSRL